MANAKASRSAIASQVSVYLCIQTAHTHTYTLQGTPNTVQDACRMCALALYACACMCVRVGVHTDELIEGCANCSFVLLPKILCTFVYI